MTGNAAHWFVDRHIAEGRGAKTAFEGAWEGGRQLTYGALAEGAGQDRCRLVSLPRGWGQGGGSNRGGSGHRGGAFCRNVSHGLFWVRDLPKAFTGHDK